MLLEPYTEVSTAQVSPEIMSRKATTRIVMHRRQPPSPNHLVVLRHAPSVSLIVLLNLSSSHLRKGRSIGKADRWSCVSWRGLNQRAWAWLSCHNFSSSISAASCLSSRIAVPNHDCSVFIFWENFPDIIITICSMHNFDSALYIW